MPSRLKALLAGGLICIWAMQTSFAYEPPSGIAPRPFTYRLDTFAFANETVWNYVGGSLRAGPPSSRLRKRDYTRRCFVVARAAVQFWKFARFDPRAARLSPGELQNRIREVTARSVWLPELPSGRRTVIPGFASLREASAAAPSAFQENIGLGWPIYVRPGNAPIAVPVTRATEARLQEEMCRDLSANYPTIVWLYLFPSLRINHVVVVLSGHRSGSAYRYLVYDPNYTDGPKRLDYDLRSKTFVYQPTFYFKGGAVDARAIYRGLLQ